MTVSARDRKMLMLLGGAIVVFLLLQYVILPPPHASSVEPVAQTSEQLRQNVAQLRQTAAALPVRESLLKQVDADLADREHGIIQAGTAAEAQSELLQIAQRVGKSNGLDIRSGELAPPKTFGDYGLVYAGVTFDCQIEQLLNFLADLTREPELIVPSEEHITSGDPKKKVMTVRMVLAGAVAKKLIPEKKALSAF